MLLELIEDKNHIKQGNMKQIRIADKNLNGNKSDELLYRRKIYEFKK